MFIPIQEASSVAVDVLVDVLDHFIDSFFKLLKNLQGIHQADINSDQELIHNNPPNNFYSHQVNYKFQSLLLVFEF